jgi:autotransporter-associated beta strand protein
MKIKVFLLVIVALALVGPAGAAPRFWDGSINGNFNNAGNWAGNVVPVAGDDLIFQAGVTRLLVTNDFSPNRAFTTITFQGSNYFVRGNPLLLTNGILSFNPVGANHIDADVQVRASQFWEAQGALSSLDVNGDVALNANTLTVRANTGDFFIGGVISGTGNLVKTNVGTLRLDGSGHNTYSGFTRFDGGVLELDKFAIIPALTNFISIPGDLTIGDGNGLVGTDVLRLLADDQIADTSDVTVRNSGLFDLNDNTDRIGSLTMQGGTVDSDTGALILGGNITTLSETNTAFINGNLSLGGASRTFEVNSGPVAADLRINAVISGGSGSLIITPGFTKTGGGSLFLAGTNTYNGITTVSDGQLAVLADRALGATSTPVGGSARTVVSGPTANLFLSGVQVTNEDLTIDSVNPGGAFNASGASIWTGDILLNVNTFISSIGSLLLNGAITGTGGFTKLSPGSVILAGTNANTYSGTTTVRDGTLLLDKDTTAVNDGAMSGPLVIGEDELPEGADIVRYLACCQLPDDTDITINASGLLDLNGFGENVGDIIFNGGDIAAPLPGSILPTGDITVNRNTNSQAIISGRMSVLSNPIIDVTGHFFSPDLHITALVIGAGGITKNGVGELGLSAANTYSGLTTVNDGFLIVDDSLALGSTASGTVVNSGAVLALRFGVAVPAESLSLAGPGQSAFGALSSGFGSNSWAGNITLTSNATISVDASDLLNLTGAISGGFDIIKTDIGTLIFSGATANSFDDMFVNSGTLVLNKSIANGAGPADLTIGDGSGTDIVRLLNDNQIADTTEVHVSLGGRFDLDDMSETTGAIDGRGIIDLGSGILRAGADNDSSGFAGLIIGTGSLFKLGTGTWTLSGDNSYTGQTTVSAGTLIVDGSQPQSPVAVNGTANLGGSGIIGNLQVFGSLRPGASPGVLTSSNVSFAAAGDYFVELNGAAPGSGYDQLNIRGTNQLGSSTLHLSVGAGFAPFEGQDFVIINNDGSEAIVGTFNGLPNGSLITANGLQFRIRYSDIFLNDVVLTCTNAAARLVSTSIAGGNGDGNIDLNECNFLSMVLTNTTGGILNGVTATLFPRTPGISVTLGTSAYPTMAANARATNTTPFQFSVGPGFICGTNVDFDLVVQTPANGTFTVPVSLVSGSAGAAVRFNNNTVTAIPDNGSVDLLMNVSGITTPIKRVVVSMHITHTADSDLDISLIGPDGTIVNLSSDNGGAASDYGSDCTDATRTTFNDAGSTAITSASAPFVGTFRPEQPLNVFNEKFGAEANGTWRLRVADDTAGGLGSVRCWSLLISPTACGNSGGGCEACPEDSVIRGILGVGSLVQTNRLVRDSIKSVCGLSKGCPGATGPLGDRSYDAYIFENGPTNACITVTLQSGGCPLFSVAYTNAYNPLNLCQNYLADMGGTAPLNNYSFRVGPEARFVVVVHGVDPGDACSYTLSVNGGSCRPRLNITEIADNRVDIDWTTAAPGYLLERTNVLRNPSPAWPVVPGTPSISASRFHVIDNIALPPTNSFYRLRKP